MFHGVAHGERFSRRNMRFIRPVTVEGQNFEIPEDPSQTLPEKLPMDRS